VATLYKGDINYAPYHNDDGTFDKTNLMFFVKDFLSAAEGYSKFIAITEATKNGFDLNKPILYVEINADGTADNLYWSAVICTEDGEFFPVDINEAMQDYKYIESLIEQLKQYKEQLEKATPAEDNLEIIRAFEDAIDFYTDLDKKLKELAKSLSNQK